MSRKLPDGFVSERNGPAELIVDARWRTGFVTAGLGSPAGWQALLGHGTGGPGRGATALVEFEDGPTVRAKQLRRGGLTRHFWRDRFLGRRRPLDNLGVPLVARRRGVATPPPVATLIVRDAPGLYRAWLAVEEVAEARDLRRALIDDPESAPAVLAATLTVVREMHDAGVEHRDLNVGNLLLSGRDGSAWIIDLDRARLHDGPLSFRMRQQALRRLERSCVKTGLADDPADWVRERIYDDYAGADSELAARLRSGRATGRLQVAVHRAGWRR